MLDWLAGTYLHSRYFLGLGLVALTALVIAIGVGGSNTWVVAVAGVVIIGHTFASKSMGSEDAGTALFIDLTAVMAAAMVFGNTNSSPTPVLLTFVGASVMIALFTQRLARVAILTWVAGFTFVSLLIVWDWDVRAALGGYVGSVFLATFVIGVVAAIRSRIVELEATKAQTVGVVGHELRNHLAGVVAAIQLIRTEQLDQGEVNEILQLAHDQAEEASDVIEDLVTASRVEGGSLQSITESIDLRRATETIVRRTSLDAGDIRYSSPHAPIWAIADEVRYKQILRNLLTNALRYGGDQIWVSIEQLPDVVSVVVADNGEGVDPGEVSSLFHPYTVGANAETVPDSNGLGLWIARGLAQAMDGSLTYRRNSGQTIFELVLPAGHDPGAQGLEDRLTRHTMAG